ncbi:MAG: hypothetical protein JW846_08665 [Dehalococcoidia bacterium]|nr:hypothetical protein [Dehalococcoidia bacterium]
MSQRFAISVVHDDCGRPVGSVPSLNGCVVVASNMEEMLDLLEEEVRTRLIARGEMADEIELVGYDAWTM